MVVNICLSLCVLDGNADESVAVRYAVLSDVVGWLSAWDDVSQGGSASLTYGASPVTTVT